MVTEVGTSTGGFPRDTYALRIEGLAGTVVEPPHRSRTPSPVTGLSGRLSGGLSEKLGTR